MAEKEMSPKKVSKNPAVDDDHYFIFHLMTFFEKVIIDPVLVESMRLLFDWANRQGLQGNRVYDLAIKLPDNSDPLTCETRIFCKVGCVKKGINERKEEVRLIPPIPRILLETPIPRNLFKLFGNKMDKKKEKDIKGVVKRQKRYSTLAKEEGQYAKKKEAEEKSKGLKEMAKDSAREAQIAFAFAKKRKQIANQEEKKLKR